MHSLRRGMLTLLNLSSSPCQDSDESQTGQTITNNLALILIERQQVELYFIHFLYGCLFRLFESVKTELFPTLKRSVIDYYQSLQVFLQYPKGLKSIRHNSSYILKLED